MEPKNGTMNMVATARVKSTAREENFTTSLAEGVDLLALKLRRGVEFRSPTAVLSAIPLQAALHKVHSDVANPKRFWAFGSNPACCRYQRLQLPAGMLGKP